MNSKYSNIFIYFEEENNNNKIQNKTNGIYQTETRVKKKHNQSTEVVIKVNMTCLLSMNF